MWNCTKVLLLFLLLNDGIDSESVLEKGAENGILSESLFPNTCVTESCTLASISILEYMNTSINPCDDFYKFVCGNFATVEKYGDRVSSVRKQHIDKKLEKFLESTTTSEYRNKFKSQDWTEFKLAKNFLLSCKNKQTSEAEGIQKVVNLIEKYGGWPVIQGDDWNEENWDLTATLGKMSQDGLNNIAAIFDVTITNGTFNFNTSISWIYYLDIGQPKFYIAKDLLFENHEPYLDFMIDITVDIFNATESDARIQMVQALDFEMRLAMITDPTQVFQTQGVRIQELQRGYPYLNWLTYIRSVLPSDVEIDDNNWVFAEINSQYFMRLELLLNQTKKRTIANYLIWRAIFFLSQYLGEELYQRRLKFVSKFTKQEQTEISRYDYCYELTELHLPVAISTIFIRLENQSSNVIKAGVELANNVRSEFVNMLREVRWMDQKTKCSLIGKAKNINMLFAEPTFMTHKIDLKKYYDGLNLSESSNFFENVLHVLRFEQLKEYRKLHQAELEKKHLRYHLDAREVNAFYYNEDNVIYIPAAKLGSPYFATNLPNYLNYGALGYIIGHEITHGFDSFSKSIGWSYEAEQEFSVRANCYEQQYSNYGLSGKETFYEDIADNGGVKAAYRAYQQFVNHSNAEPLLPALAYTQRQMFWISLAHSYCSIDTEPENEDTESGYDHSPLKYRVTGMVKNMPEFARDFKCLPGSNMNPISKCELW